MTEELHKMKQQTTIRDSLLNVSHKKLWRDVVETSEMEDLVFINGNFFKYLMCNIYFPVQNVGASGSTIAYRLFTNGKHYIFRSF